jgi:hypothetical protein
MKKIRICMLVLVVAGGGNRFAMAQVPAARSAEQKDTREIYGKIQSIKGTLVTLQTRTGTLVQVDVKPAVAAQRSVPLIVGRAIAVKGKDDKAGVLHAEILQRAKDSSILWPADR